MPIVVIFAVEIVGLLTDVFLFHAAVTEILVVTPVLFFAGVVCLFRKRFRRGLVTLVAIPIVVALSQSGHLMDRYLEGLVGQRGKACFATVSGCDLPERVMGYRIKISPDREGFGRDRVFIDGYNSYVIIFDPSTGTFEHKAD